VADASCLSGYTSVPRFEWHNIINYKNWDNGA
jgi:hypothetical protein